MAVIYNPAFPTFTWITPPVDMINTTYNVTLNDTTSVTIRPVAPDDQSAYATFQSTLSESSVYYRWFRPYPLSFRIAPEALRRACTNTDNETGLVAVTTDRRTGATQILGECRLITPAENAETEFAVIVSDPYQRRGLGTALVRCLDKIASAKGIARMRGDIHPQNIAMVRLCQKLGIEIHYSYADRVIHAFFVAEQG